MYQYVEMDGMLIDKIEKEMVEMISPTSVLRKGVYAKTKKKKKKIKQDTRKPLIKSKKKQI